jgi:hypothetical protein
MLLVQKSNKLHDLDFCVIPIQQLQDAIDYIIHYNPVVVIVNESMTDTAIMTIKHSVDPWFSGKIIKHSEH